jgi:hypothetical protein
MNLNSQLDPRPEAMSDVPGVCELPLTRALVQYRDVHELEVAGGRIQDIGLALVLEGRYASASEVLELGSADLKILDLSAELVVLDWVYEPTLEHTRGLVREAASTGDRRSLERFSFRLALRVLERIGYGALTRPTLMRIGFRDICRDLDLHEGTSVRIVMGSGHMVRAHFDYDGSALVFRTATGERDSRLEEALEESFPTGDLRRLIPATELASGGYQVRFPLPHSVDEARAELRCLREGLVDLIGRFEPERKLAVDRITEAFGRRETLAQLHLRPPLMPAAPLENESGVLADFTTLPRPETHVGDAAFGSAALH